MTEPTYTPTASTIGGRSSSNDEGLNVNVATESFYIVIQVNERWQFAAVYECNSREYRREKGKQLIWILGSQYLLRYMSVIQENIEEKKESSLLGSRDPGS